MIQIWCVIKDAMKSEVVEGMTADEVSTAEGGLTKAELEMLWSVGAEQYVEVGRSHDGLRLLHCIITPERVPLVEEFLTGRGQKPEIVKATTVDGTMYEELPDDSELFDSFFIDTPSHQFAGWAV